jgi:DNA-binding transcriptional MerR regulator
MGTNLKEIAKQEQVPYSTLAGWIQRGLIEPSHRTGKSGAAVLLDDKNVVEFKNLIRLRKGGLPLQRARHLMEDLRAAGFNPMSRGVFVVLDRQKGRVLRISIDRKTAREVLGPHKGQYMMMVELLPEGRAKEAAQR